MRKIGFSVLLTLLLLALAAACSRQAPSVKEAVNKALEQAGYDHVTVAEDRDKGVITLKGTTRSDELKGKAGQVAQAAAPGKVIANELSIEPVGAEGPARKIESNVDDAIDKNYKAALIANHLDDAGIHYDVKNGVLSLTGTVKTQDIRTEAEKVGASVPNVQQVVNRIQVRSR